MRAPLTTAQKIKPMFSRFKRSISQSLNERFNDWITNMNGELDDRSDVVALNFGIIETPNSHSVYLIGSSKYDEHDDYWACDEDFVAKDKYFEFKQNEIAGKNGEQIESLVGELIRNFISTSSFGESILNQVQTLTYGFDEGTLTKIV